MRVEHRGWLLLFALGGLAAARSAQGQTTPDPLKPAALEGPFSMLGEAHKSATCAGRFVTSATEGTNLLKSPSEQFLYAAVHECRSREDTEMDTSSSNYALILRTRRGYFIQADIAQGEHQGAGYNATKPRPRRNPQLLRDRRVRRRWRTRRQYWTPASSQSTCRA